MATHVALQNPRTNQIQVIKVGFSWTSFFFADFFGIPLFLRGLTKHGLIMVAFQLVRWINANQVVWWINASEAEKTPGAVYAAPFLLIVTLGLDLFYGFRANALAGQKLLAEGWTFAKPNSSEAVIAAATWGYPLPKEAPKRSSSEGQGADVERGDDVVDKLERLVALKQQGLLSDAEFAAEKSKMI
jgi:hypothetical protein